MEMIKVKKDVIFLNKNDQPKKLYVFYEGKMQVLKKKILRDDPDIFIKKG